MLNEEVVRKFARRGGRRISRKAARQEIYAIVEEISTHVSKNLVFGYHSIEDMRQHAAIEALEVLRTSKYDASRPLENFLQVHIRNRLLNFKRKHFMRCEPPCDCCDRFEPPEDPCSRWKIWNQKNLTKQNLMRPIDVQLVQNSAVSIPSKTEAEASLNELKDIILRGLPEDLRASYKLMIIGEKVHKNIKKRVRAATLRILKELEMGERHGL